MLIILTRTITIAYIIFLALLASDVFNIIGLSPMEKGIAFVIHLIPAFLTLGCLITAWIRPRVGGILFLVLAVGFTIFFHTYRDLNIFAVVSLPLVIVGGLFIRAAWLAKKN